MAGEYTANVRLVDGMQFVATAGVSKGTIVLDGAPEAGGQGAGIRPTEALLCALGSCTAMDVISILRKKRQDVTGFEVNVLGHRAAQHPRRYEQIELEFVVRGRGVDRQAVARAIELSQTKYCGVTASLNAEITYTFRIIEDAPAVEPAGS